MKTTRNNMMAEMGKIHSQELIKKFFEGKYPPDIERRFHLWLLSEKKWDEKEEALEDIWETLPYGDPRQAVGSLNQVRTKLGLPGETVKLGNRRLALKVAAAVIPFLMLAGAGYFLFDRFVKIDSGQQTIALLEAVAGSTVLLPDNSVVEITEGTMTYPAAFSGPERKVSLEGSGYFEVTKNSEIPFIVETPFLNLRVTGTQFMLSSDKENATATVSMVEGSVEVTIEGREAVSLSKGEELRYNNSSGELTLEMIPEQLTDREALTSGVVKFDSSTLEEIISAAARSRGYELEIKRGSLGNKRYNIKFIEGENIEEILGVLNVLTNSSFDYIIENNKIIIE